MARIALTTHLAASPDRVWHYVQRSALLDHIAAPMIRFKPRDGAFPEQWADGHYTAMMLLSGILPLGQQTIGIEFPPPKGETLILRDNGYGSLIKRWDHWIFVEPEGGGTRYTDRVDIEAGILTPFVALFARLFYGHRQRRWKKLIAANFAPIGG